MSRRTLAGFSVGVLALLAMPGRPAMASARSAEPVMALDNVRVSSDEFLAHIEPSLAVNPRAADNLLAACRVFVGPRIGLAAFASFDGGRTWHSDGLLPGVVPDFDGNATVAFDPHGHGFISGVVAGSTTPRSGDTRVWRTDDGGRNFDDPVVAIAGAGGLTDHPGLAIDRWTRTQPADVYAAAALVSTGKTDVVFSHSGDGGRSFSAPRLLDSNAGIPVLAAGPGGTVSVVYLAPSSSGSWVLRAMSSTDHGRTFEPATDLAQIAELAPGLGPVTAKSGPAIAAAPYAGRFYAVITSYDEPSNQSRILMFASDHRLRWRGPIVVASSDTTIYLQPQVAVDGHGRIGIFAYAADIATARIDVMLYRSEHRRLGFGPPRRITTASFDPTQAINTGDTRWLGNYQGLAATESTFHPIWTDTRTGNAEIFTAAVSDADLDPLAVVDRMLEMDDPA